MIREQDIKVDIKDDFNTGIKTVTVSVTITRAVQLAEHQSISVAVEEMRGYFNRLINWTGGTET